MQSYVRTVTSLSKEKKKQKIKKETEKKIHKRNIEKIKIVSNHQLLK